MIYFSTDDDIKAVTKGQQMNLRWLEQGFGGIINHKNLPKFAVGDVILILEGGKLVGHTLSINQSVVFTKTPAEFGFSTRAQNCLSQEGISSIAILVTFTEAEIVALPSISRNVLVEIKQRLKLQGLELKQKK